MESKLKNDRRILGALILYKILEKKSLGIDEQKSRREVFIHDDDFSDIPVFEHRGIDGQKSIWEEYKGFSKVLGDDFMSFPDFEHFYLKLEKGECELDYDGRPDYNRNLLDMPEHIIRKISKKLTNGEKSVLRETSSRLRRTIDPCLEEKRLNIEIDTASGAVFFGGAHEDDDSRHEIKYSKEISEETGELEVRRRGFNYSFENSERTLEESMIRDIRHLLKKPKTRLVELQIRLDIDDDSFFDQLKPLLESQEDIREVRIYSDQLSQFISILSCLKSGTLETIDLGIKAENMDLSGIVEMDQVKQAKRVYLFCQSATYPLSHLMHLEEFVGKRISLEPEEVLGIKEMSTRTGKVKKFRVLADLRMSLPRLNELLGPPNPEFNDSLNRRHFRIQNSDEFMKLEISERCFMLSREKTIEEPRDLDPLHIRFYM